MAHNSNEFLDALKEAFTAQGKVNDQKKAQQQQAVAAAAPKDFEVIQKNILPKLQAVANEQNPFDKEMIDALMKQINELTIVDNAAKKSINQMLNQQKTALTQNQKTDGTANPDTQKAGETVDPNKQPAQGDAAAGTDPAQGGAPAQDTEDTKQGVSKEEQQVVNTTTAQAAPQIEAMDAAMEKIKQFSQKSKYIAAAVQEWANFKDALNKTINANKG